MGEQPTPPAGQPSLPPPVVSASGGIAVRTTERGLPTQLKISSAEMSRAPQDLAHEILSLCQLSATRQQVAHRRDLAAGGVNPAVIRDLQLATERDLTKAEQARHDADGPPPSWMTSL